jgi:hypothetical protein
MQNWAIEFPQDITAESQAFASPEAIMADGVHPSEPAAPLEFVTSRRLEEGKGSL